MLFGCTTACWFAPCWPGVYMSRGEKDSRSPRRSTQQYPGEWRKQGQGRPCSGEWGNGMRRVKRLIQRKIGTAEIGVAEI
jgi:hypothetical protein